MCVCAGGGGLVPKGTCKSKLLKPFCVFISSNYKGCLAENVAFI